MTVIAYRDGVLAADTLVTESGRLYGFAQKIVRSRAGHIGGAGGPAEAGVKFMAWIEAGCVDAPPEHKDPADGIVIYPDGRTMHWDGGPVLLAAEAPFFALGCGAPIALGAMAAGADARRAVEIAIRYDCYCGGEITVLTLGGVK